MKKLVIGLVAVLAVAVGAYAFLKPTVAPEVSLTTLDGRTVTTQSLRGKVVLVNFWATTCTTCMAEMPKVIDTYKRFSPKGFETVAVAMDYDNPAWIKDYTARAKLPFTVGHDTTGSVARAFGDVRLTPTTFLIDKRGRIVQQYLGEPDFPKLHALLDKLLAEPA
ncbi:MAG: TlpA disulfide reductase family protein [Rhodocyclaceae bacterium]